MLSSERSGLFATRCTCNDTPSKGRDRALIAVKRNGHALRFVSKELQKDREIVLAAVKTNAYALLYASDELRNDREVVLAAVDSYSCGNVRSGLALQFASVELRNNREIVLASVKSDRYAIKYASNELQRDPMILSWSNMTQIQKKWQLVRDHCTVNCVGSYWYMQAMYAKFDTEGFAVMIGHGAKRSLREYEEWSLLL